MTPRALALMTGLLLLASGQVMAQPSTPIPGDSTKPSSTLPLSGNKSGPPLVNDGNGTMRAPDVYGAILRDSPTGLIAIDPIGRRARAEAARVHCRPLSACETDGTLLHGR